MNRILVVDDEAVTRLAFRRVLERDGYQVSEAADGREAVEIFNLDRPSVVVIDLKMPVMDGVEAFGEMKRIDPTVPVIFVTAFADIATAVDTMKHGAYDFLAKPVEPGRLIMTVRRAVEKLSLEMEMGRLRASEDASLEWTLGKDPRMKKIIEQIKQVARTDFSVILQGETGTGKTFIAKMIHTMSRRSAKPYTMINIGAIPETLMESELFGHDKGAFTGASQSKKGVFERSNGGTILIDDIDNMTPVMQGKLLHIVEQKELMRLGGQTPVKVDVRIMAATNMSMQDAIARGSFREDLFFRLGEFIMTVPPLRERPEDIPFLADKFAVEAATELNKPVHGLSDEATALLAQYAWPGNVRQLKNVIRRAVLTAGGGVLAAGDIDFIVEETQGKSGHSTLPATLREAVHATEKSIIRRTLDETGGNRTKTAARLGIDIKTLRTKLNEYAIR